MDSNGFYYTLSTIAQTLAGTFAFLVAVALYRLEAIKESRPGLERELEITKRNEASLTNIRDDDPVSARLVAVVKEHASKMEEALRDEDNVHETIISELDKSFKFTSITVVTCFFTLPWINILTCKAYYMLCVGLLIVVGMAIYCVWWRYRPLVASAVRATRVAVR